MKKVIFFIALSVALVACSKDTATTTVTPVSSVTVSNLPADTIIGLTTQGIPYGAGKYTFYSLETNKVVASADSATNKWDLGFRGTSIITNSGNSGPAAGGGFVFVGLYNNLTTIPADSTFKLDNAPSSYAITSGSNRGWYVYDGINNLVTPIPGRVLVIRTATGKYAKVEILNYYKGGITPAATASDAIKLKEQRYYTFRFTFQPSGTKTF
ncbi:MAG: HmuY family protein [Sediminibacterium sp.]|nr:HmuY family protein [Sediminibacterium sp.]